MGYAQQQAALQRFEMDPTYKARLARGIRLEVERGTHHQDIKAAINQLLERKLSPGLLRHKVEDLHAPKGYRFSQGIVADDPYADLPEQKLDPSWLETEV
jgi:hypothetical protein